MEILRYKIITDQNFGVQIISLDGLIIVVVLFSITNEILFVASARLLVFEILVTLPTGKDTTGSTGSVKLVLRFGEVGDDRVLGHSVLLNLMKSRQVGRRCEIHLTVRLLVDLHLLKVGFYSVNAGTESSLRLRLVDEVQLLLLNNKYFFIVIAMIEILITIDMLVCKYLLLFFLLLRLHLIFFIRLSIMHHLITRPIQLTLYICKAMLKIENLLLLTFVLADSESRNALVLLAILRNRQSLEERVVVRNHLDVDLILFARLHINVVRLEDSVILIEDVQYFK